MRENAGVFVFVIPPVWLSTCSVMLSTCSVLKMEREEGVWSLAVKISAKSNFLVATLPPN